MRASITTCPCHTQVILGAYARCSRVRGDSMGRRTLVYTLALILLLLLLSPATALAAPTKELPSGALVDDPSLTTQEEARLDALTIKKEITAGIRSSGDPEIMAPNPYGLITRPVTRYVQETSYYCGPASARQALSFHKVFSGSALALPSQTTLANQIGTTPAGSTTTAIASTLNSYDGTFGPIYYIASDIANTPNPTETYWNRIGAMLSAVCNPTTPITLNQTKYLPRYGGYSCRHYITMSGIDGRYSPKRMRCADPHNNPAYGGIYWGDVGSTTKNGFAKTCYYADLGGSNKVMAW